MNAGTVCGLGNRLSASMDRKAAFREAWRIVKDKEVRFAVAGVTAGNRQKALAKLARYDPRKVHIFLLAEPSNKHDPSAIAVMVLPNGAKNAYKLGYIKKEKTCLAKAFLGSAPRLSIAGGDLLGARLSIAV
jgi:hypothetical protein